MIDLMDVRSALDAATGALGAFGAVFEPLLLVASLALAIVCVAEPLARWRRLAIGSMALLLLIGEAVLAAFHLALSRSTPVFDPATGAPTGSFAVPLWIESEKLYVWAVVLALLTLLVRVHAGEMLPGLGLGVALLTAGAAGWAHPFTEPLPEFLARYGAYADALAGNANAAAAMYPGLEASRQYYYNTWYMWVHPPLLFISYGAFAVSFAAIVLTAVRRHSSYEAAAYRWAAFGYLPLTAGMLLGFPWAILAWRGESWWWSGKVNMSIMMWLLYAAYLHSRLYLRRRGMWRTVVVLGVLAFVSLVMTYLATYVVPGAHSYA